LFQSSKGDKDTNPFVERVQILLKYLKRSSKVKRFQERELKEWKKYSHLKIFMERRKNPKTPIAIKPKTALKVDQKICIKKL